MCSTGSLPEFESKCKDLSKCEPLTYDDSKCAEACKCCVGISDYGDSNKCTSACRKCRKFGDTWNPRRPMKPLNYHDIYNDLPGYTTTGDFVEHFGVADAPMKTFLAIGLVMLAYNKFCDNTLTPLNGLLYTLAIFFALKWFKGAF
jgi:hypothetical protein